MIQKSRALKLAVGWVLVLSSGEAFAQCSGGRGGASMSTGSMAALNSSLSYPSNGLTSNYPSSIGLMAQQYQRQIALVDNQFYAIASQNAERQRLAADARDAQARPYRLARAEAKRAARDARIAARLAERDGESGRQSSERFLLTSAIADE